MSVERTWPEYKKFCGIRARAILTGSCDLRYLERACPTTILPLVDFLRKSRLDWIPPSDETLSKCMTAAIMEEAESAESAESADSGTSDFPILRLPRNPRDLGKVLARISAQHDGGREYGGRNAFMYVMGELAHNVYDHANSRDSSIMAQRCGQGGFVEVSVLDDGITMAGSLKRSGIFVEDDTTAIAMAMNGLSSKSESRRGYGLRSNARMCVRGLRGSILAVSGRGALEFGEFGPGPEEGQEGYKLDDKVYQLEGTLVSVRIPFQEMEVDLYDFT